jgi:2-C-methyl-D-erythritol 4-phosphate cytidylyltransferase
MAAATFSVLVVTAPPPGTNSEGAGAFVKIDGREALLRAAELFLNRDNVKQIQVAFLPEDAEEAKRKHGGHFGFSGVKVVTGGPKWIDQWAAAEAKLSAEATHVIVHDAARPAVPYSDIEALMTAAEESPAAALALAAPVRAELVELDEGGEPVALHGASRFMQLLTPQAYTVAKFKEIVASRQEVHASQLKLIRGSALNVRVGGAGDASLARAMIGMLPKPKVKPPSSPFEEAQW